MRELRTYWYRPSYWIWIWRYRVAVQTKAALAAIVMAAVLASGVLAATGFDFEAADAPSTPGQGSVLGVQTVINTVQQLVTVRRDGRVVTRPVRVVDRRTVVQGVTHRETDVVYNTITTPGGTRVVTYERVRTLPRRTTREIVTQSGQVMTVSRASPPRTVTAERVVTSERVVTTPGASQTRTVTEARTLTDVRTVVDTRTVTETRTVTTTQPVTITDLQTTTVTEPITVTVTVPRPKG
ncbi:MAG TPA: hypothetical protein VEY87_00650 [Gaiellaceae bacterium]|jgi:hypothetical protein|nr:hypothetical protein [Gaiellaceae bacterium]